MKKITTAALLLSTVLAAPAFAQNTRVLNAGDNTQWADVQQLQTASHVDNNLPKTRAEVRAELADAVQAGYAPQSANRRDTAFVYGTVVRAQHASHSVSSIPVENDTAD
ncbi:MAG: DUF4148 domain-containing protein [Janthinobacterium lividum]